MSQLSLKLTDSEQRRLARHAAASRGRARKLLRAQLLLLVNEGRSVAEAASIVHTDEELAHRLIGSFRRLPRTKVRAMTALRRSRSQLQAWLGGNSPGFQNSPRRHVALDLLVVGIVAAIPMIIVLPPLLEGRMIMGNNDFGWHTQRGLTFSLIPFSPPSPHFLYPLLVRIFYLLTSQISLALTVTVVLVGARALAGGAIYAIARGRFSDGGPRLGRTAAVLTATCALLIESPRVLLYGPRLGDGGAFLPLQAWFNPTALTALPFAILGVALVVRYVDRAKKGELGWRFQALTLLVLLLAALAKPSLTQGVVLVLPFWTLLYARDGLISVWKVTWSVTSRLVTPLAAVSIWQIWFLSDPARHFAHGGGGSVGWSPLTTAKIWDLGNPAAWLALLVPMIGVIIGGTAWLKRPKIVLLLFALAATAAQVMLLAEKGARSSDGNLGWGAQLVYFLLAIEAIRELFASRRDPGKVVKALPYRQVFAGLILVASLAGGLVSIYDGGIRESPCLRGMVSVTHYDAAVPGGTYVAEECA
ncbi:MAG: hypothetical protein WBA45_00435 [Microthrixaceae bacterium]